MKSKELRKANRKAKELIKGSENSVILTDNGYAIYGTTPKILEYFMELVEICRKLKGVDDDIIKEIFNMSFLPKEEREKLISDKIDNLLEKLSKELNKKGEN